ncbi:hypothetical protein II898_01320 [bacterium]|nr:hypothetical protein [bacterium]MBR0192553.1 hypothetical protein [Thermoguttaceae bacterium]
MFKQVVFLLAFLGNTVALWADDVFPPGEMADGNFVPGTVLIYDHGQWRMTEEKNAVDPEKYTFVIIHGAHCSLKANYISRLADALEKERPDANILAVDWNAWSSVGSTEIIDWGMTITFKILGKNKHDKTTLKDIFEEIVQKVIPLEQARHIPEIADRLNWKLFGEAGKRRTFVTIDPGTKEEIRTKMSALGLDPAKTHLIGHSHGAHVAGLIGTTLRRNRAGKLDRISALDPSTSIVHDYPENLMGSGWDASSARIVAVFRTTLFFSSDKETTNDSFYFDWRSKGHPFHHPPMGGQFFKWPQDVLNAEFQCHRGIFDQFAEFIQKTDFLNENPKLNKRFK